MARNLIKKAVKEGIKRGRGRPKGSTNKTKTTKRSEAPIKSERSKIAEANAKAKAKRAKATGKKSSPSVAAAKTITSRTSRARNKTGGRGNIRATALGLGASAAAIGTLNKKKPAPKETFAQAFKKARAKGEGTKFTHNGKKYTAVTKTDLKKKGYDANELAAYNKRGGKSRGPLNRLGQKAKKVLLGKDKKFGGDKGIIDFVRKPKKKAAGGMMGSPQAMPTMRRRPPSPPKPPTLRRKPKVRTEAIDPRLPRGKVGKGPLEPSDSKTRVPSQRKGLAGLLKKRSTNMKKPPALPKSKKGPGMKGGGMMKTKGYKSGGMMKTKGYRSGGMASKGNRNGGAVNKRNATGAAKRGFGKAYMKGKR